MRRLVTAMAAVALVAATPAAVWAADPDDDDFASIRPAADNWSYRIVIYNGRGKAVSTPITRPVIGRPAISPNGKRIVFTSPLRDGSNGRYGLFMARIDGSNLRRLTRPHGVDRDPAWSPDGTMIAYSRDVGGNLVRSSCCTIRWIRFGAGGGAVAGTTGGINPSWSPDGRWLAYERTDGVWVTRRNGSGAYQLAGASGTEPAWSPNGQRIAYVRPNAGKWEIAVRPSGGGAAVARVASNQRIESPSWDPDSRTIFYLRYSGDGYDGRSNTQVWMDRASAKPVRLFTTVRPLITLSHHANDDGPDCDVDGDGRADLAVGIPREDEPGAANLGAAAMMYGSGSGIGAAGNQYWSQGLDSIKGEPSPGNMFGAAVGCGDFDADGFADLAVGIPGDAADAGAVTVIRGAGSGLTASGDQRWHQDVAGILGAASSGNEWGAALATGDVDGDGRADLAVGAPGERNTRGAVSVMFGRASGLSANDERWHQDSSGVPGSGRQRNAFGAALAFGDFDGDGSDDLAVGAPGDVQRSGSVVILYGRPNGLTAAGSQRWHQDRPGIGGSAKRGNDFGSAVAVGDFDGDGFDDVAVGAPGDRGGRGAVTVLYGTTTGLSSVKSQRWDQDDQGVGGNVVTGNVFGTALAVGDFDDDGFDDLAVGVPGDVNTAGSAVVLYGTAAGLVAAGSQRWHQDAAGVPGAAAAGNTFGAALASADYDDDGRDDLAVGAPGDLGGAGSVTVLYGKNAGLAPTGAQRWHQDAAGVVDSAEPGDAYGAGL